MRSRLYPLVRAAVSTVLLVGALGGMSGSLMAQVTDTAAGRAAKPPKKRANVISAEEIATLGGTLQTAFGIVQRLRPAMLRARSGSTSQSAGGAVDVSANEIQVFLDNQRMGGIRALEDILLSQILEIRYLSANDATTLFGVGNTAGVIQVIGKR